LMVVKSLKSLLILFFKTVLFFGVRTDPLYWYCFPIFVLISYISTIFLHSYWSPISVPFFCIRTDPLYRYCFPILWYMIV